MAQVLSWHRSYHDRSYYVAKPIMVQVPSKHRSCLSGGPIPAQLLSQGRSFHGAGPTRHRSYHGAGPITAQVLARRRSSGDCGPQCRDRSVARPVVHHGGAQLYLHHMHLYRVFVEVQVRMELWWDLCVGGFVDFVGSSFVIVQALFFAMLPFC